MNDETTKVEEVETPPAEVPPVAAAPVDTTAQSEPVPPVVPPKAEHPQAANIATAQDMYEELGQDLKVVGAWLHATAAGAFTSVEHAIEHILGKV